MKLLYYFYYFASAKDSFATIESSTNEPFKKNPVKPTTT